MNNDELLKRREAAVARGIASVTSVFTERAKNAELWDVEGKRYIDFASGLAVVNTGHLHARIKTAVEQQLNKVSHPCFQVTPYEPYIALAEKLNEIVPGNTEKKSILFTTGVEAVENAIKIARYATNRSGVIAFTGGFHGRTYMGMALTGKVVPYKAGFGPSPQAVYHVPYPISYHGVSIEDSLNALESLFKADIAPDQVAAIIIEPVLGEGGFYIAPPEFLQTLRKICDDNGIVFIADEVQTGFARTGKMFAIEHADIEADIMAMAKGLAGGFPLSAVTGKTSIMDSPVPGGLGGTFAGSPLACAAALAVLEIIEAEGLIERANEIGQLLVNRISSMMDTDAPCVGEVRNLGAMVSMELVKDRESREPDADLTKAIVQEAATRGLILLPCGIRGNVIRYLVPLTAPDALINEGMDILQSILTGLTK